MPEPPLNPPSRRKVLFPNPFYVALLIASAAFVVTALMYYVSPLVFQRALDRPGPGPGPVSRKLVVWLDRRGPLVLGVEFVVMFVSGSLAMLTDNWFPAKPARNEGKTG